MRKKTSIDKIIKEAFKHEKTSVFSKFKSLFIVGSSTLVLSAGPLLLANAASHNNLSVENPQFGKISSNYKSADPTEGYEKDLATGDTPERLYLNPILPDPFQGNNSLGLTGVDKVHQMTRFYNGIQKLNLITSETQGFYQSAVSQVVTESVVSGLVDSGELDVAKGKFTQESQAFEAYKLFNHLEDIDKSETLMIRRPAGAYDIMSSYGAIGVNQNTIGVTLPTNFYYKVSEIDLKNIPDFEPIAFNVKDTGDPNANDHDYEFVLANDENILKNLTSSSNTNPLSIAELINMDMIFVRDKKSSNIYDFDTGNNTLQDFSDKIFLQYGKSVDASGVEKIETINIFVKPTSYDDPIQFGISNSTIPDTLGSIKFGLLDNSLSPYHIYPVDKIIDGTTQVGKYEHVGKNAIDPTKEMALDSPTNPIESSFKIRSIASNWKQGTNVAFGGDSVRDAEQLRVYLSPGKKIDEKLRFNEKGSDVFDGQNNNLNITFDDDGQNYSYSPQRIIIQQDEYTSLPNVSPILLSVIPIDVTVGTETVRWAQVDIVLQKGVMQIKPDNAGGTNNGELPFEWLVSSDRVFFEPPTGVAEIPNGDISQHNPRTIAVEPKTEVADIYKEVLGTVFANWWDIFDGKDGSNYLEPNETWFPETAATPGGTTGIAGLPSYFDIQYQGYFRNEDGNIVDYGEVINDLYKDDKVTGAFELDANSNKISIPKTSFNLINRLNDYTNRLTNWLIESNYNVLDGIRDLDHYKLEDPTEKISFVQKRIVESSGPEGHELAVAADAIVRYWSGGSLTQDQSKIINEMISFINNKGLPWNLENDVLNKNKKALDGSDPDKSTPEYMKSTQIVYHLIGIYLDDAISTLFEIEKSIFDNFRSGVLREYMQTYLTDPKAKSIGIPSEIIGKIDGLENDNLLKDVSLVYLGNVESKTVNNGAEELGSLLDFIYVNDLQTRYLTDDKKQQFDDFYDGGNGIMLDPNSYDPSSPQNLKNARSMFSILDEILIEILGPSTNSLNDIVNGIESGSIPRDATSQAIRDAVQNSINKILVETNTYTYSYFDDKVITTSSYVENLVIGRNLEAILNQYLITHPNLPPSDIAEIQTKLGAASYDVDNITRLAVNLGYYNIDYFVRGLAEEEHVPEIARDILNSNVVENLIINIPKSDRVTEFIADPSIMSKISIMTISGLMSAFSLFALITSFRKGKQQEQGKSKVLVYVIFLTMFIVSISIFGIGGLL